MPNTRLMLVIPALMTGLALAQATGPASPTPSTPNTLNLRSSLRLQDNLYLEAARFLGVTPQELVLLGQGNKSLAEIAKELGADSSKLEAALVEARNRAIDQAVQRRRLNTEEAARYKAASAEVVRALMNRPVGIDPLLEAFSVPSLWASNSLPPQWRSWQPFGWERQDRGWWNW